MTEAEYLAEISLNLSDLYLLGSISSASVLFALGWLAGHQR